MGPGRFVFVVVLVALMACGPATAPAVSTPQPAMRSAMATGSGGVRLHYLDFGGTGQPLVLLAGAGNTAWIYSELGVALARDHRVVAITRRGHGESEQPATGYDLPTLDADLRSVLDELKLDRVVLVGHSLAGAELTYFAGHHPERVAGLVYLDAAYDRSIQAPVMDAAPYSPPPPTDDDRGSTGAWEAYLRRARPDLARYWREPVVRDIRASVLVVDNKVAGSRSSAIFGEYWRETSSAAPDYKPITAPILAIYAFEDERYTLPPDASSELVEALRAYLAGPLAKWRNDSIAQLRAAHPSAEIVQMDAGHHMFLHRPEETLAHIRRFVSAALARSRS